jgi:hypothetical protein
MAQPLTDGNAIQSLLETEEALLLQPQANTPIPSERVAERVQAQLAEPLHYPPLHQAVLADDQVVLAVEAGVPQQAAVVAGALRALLKAGIDPAHVTILLAPACGNFFGAASEKTSDESASEASNASSNESSGRARTLAEELAALGHPDCTVLTHHPDQAEATAFLGPAATGHPLRLNRLLCEADFVLPLLVTPGHRTSLPPSYAGLYPGFSDRAAIDRMGQAAAEAFPAESAESFAEIQACGHHLGAAMTLQVVPGPNHTVADLFAGQAQAVTQQAAACYRRWWSCQTPARVPLVIATLSGGPEQQTWHHLGRALAAAESILEADGSIALYTELADPPGLAISHLSSGEDLLVIEREILKTPGAQSGPALRLCRALQRGSVYLHSQLRPQVVESLGLSPLDSDSELERLVQTLRPCVLLQEADRLLPTLEHPSDD